mgnify:CR=1 FL=1
MSFVVFAVSDGTGKTAEGVVRAALTQFDAANVEIVRVSNVRTFESVRKIVHQAKAAGGFIVHTLVSEEMRLWMLTEGRASDVTTIDLMGPLLVRMSELLSAQPRAEPGLFQPFDLAYLARLEAINFTVRHDDGQNLDDLEEAEIVLVGVSRTTKTPLSIYLAYRGWRVANIPITLGIDPPQKLFSLPRRRVVGLVARPERLVDYRLARVSRLGTPSMGYADLDFVRQEMAYAYRIFERRRDWPLVDVTAKPIEETAAEVVSLLGQALDSSRKFDFE